MECLSIGHLFRPRYGGIMSDRICDVSRIQSTIPARAGVGLKPEHGPDIRAYSRKVAFFEVHAENYMGAGGPPHQFLEEIRREYPLSLHGVGLSIGGEGPLSLEHLHRLRALNERYEPGLFSEHLAWSTHDTAYYNDLLPVPYNAETCRRVCDHIDQVQEVVGRQMLLENPSTYVAFEATTMQEVDFLSEIVQRTGCGLLLDVNNIHVSCVNHLQSASDYISAFPLEFVQEIHLGGHAPDLDDDGRTLLIDAHDREVDQVVWQLYGELIEKTGPIPTLIEWDNDVPEWSVLLDEAQAADRILNKFAGNLLQKVG